MSEKKSLEEVANIVGSEGLEYAVRDYLHWDGIEDSELAALWKSAAESMNAVEEYLKSKLGEDFMDEF